MKKFYFKMDPLIRIRAFEEKLKYAEYAKTLGEVNRNNMTVESVNEKRQKMLMRERKEMLNERFDLGRMVRMDTYLREMERKKLVAISANEKLKERFEETRLAAETARKKRRILEILREKREAAHEAEVEYRAMQELDEFNARPPVHQRPSENAIKKTETFENKD